MPSEPIYSLRTSEVYKILETSPQGLTQAEAEARLNLYGENILLEHTATSNLEKIILHFIHPLAGLLTAVGIIAFISRDVVLAVVIWLLVILNGALSFWREYRANQAIEKLKQILPSYTRVLRDGKDVSIPSSEVAPGDVLILAEGDNISADARVIEEYGLRTNNATLTGESLPARKNGDASYQTEISELEQPNLIFAGTSVASGTGRAVVYNTGMLTQFGRIANLTQSIPEEKSPFQKELDHLTGVITWIAVGIGVVVFLVGFFEMGKDWYPLLLLAMGIIVAAIPEGLPATLTLSLAMAVQRLAARGVLAKKLNIVETLGSVSVICTDKSGTLTQNQMTVRDIWVSRQKLKVSGVGYEPTGEILPSAKNQPFENDFFALLDAAQFCNNSRLNAPTLERPLWTCLGDQTEVAMKVTALKAGVNEDALQIIAPRAHEIPFDARRKRMTTIHRDKSLGKETAYCKGAPREVIQLCTHILLNDEVIPLTNELRAEILAANDEYARNALRVLALARRDLPYQAGKYTAELVEKDLTFLGLMAMMDPPRPEVEEAVKICKQAGIRITMITGDYGLTAESLARRVGMLSTPNPLIITGAELEAMSDIEVQKALEGEVLFARMAPEHKMRMVSAFQARGDVVAVTGDGVNDAPALRKADVGIAMGIVGTDVAKEAADIILTNDNFGAIVSAIEEGRAVYDNIRKFITYIFSSNVPEILPFMVTSIFPAIPLALRVRQILAIDLGTDLVPALALGVEKPESDVMMRPPRKRGQKLVDRKLITRALLWLGSIEAFLCYIGFVIVYMFAGQTELLNLSILSTIPIPEFLKLNMPVAQTELLAITVFHAGVVMAQIGNLIACRTEKTRLRDLGFFSNKYIFYGIAVELIGILVLIYDPWFAERFEHTPLPYYYWFGLLTYPFILYTLEWIRKRLAR